MIGRCSRAAISATESGDRVSSTMAAYSGSWRRSLPRLEATTRVTMSTSVQQERRPNKRLHSITPAGRAALRAFIAEPVKPTAIGDELLVKVQGMENEDALVVRTAPEEKSAWATAELARYERLRTRLLNGRSEQAYLEESDRIGPYLTLLRGISFEQENIRWSEFALSVIDRRIAARAG